MTIEVGSILEGVVSGITNFGAFVDLPSGQTGLVHISEVADDYVKDVREYLKDKDKVKVKVISIDQKGKISLSIKQAKPQSKKKPERTRRAPQVSFEDQVSKFLKDSEDRLASLKRNTEGKRGGRGGRRG